MATKMKNIEDLYPLSPMQQGMLFHTLYAPESGIYVEQLNCTMRGDLNPAMFERAWQQVVDRHSILRTGFMIESAKEPVQIVHRRVNVALAQDDWWDISLAEQQHRLATMLQAERHRGFTLTQPPLMRLALIRMADDTYEFVWTYHHALLDGWSGPLLFQELFACYDALYQGTHLVLEPPPRYRDYIVWLKRQNMAEAEAFWRRTLAGFTAPTPLVVDRLSTATEAAEGDPGEESITLSLEATRALQALARQHQLTVNTLVQGAWGLLLSRYSREEDVVFGATVSGRPADLPGAETMIGLFINTLPVRVQVTPDATVLAYLNALQAQQVEIRQYEYTPLVQIQGWSEVAHGQNLFESILVFENYPMDAALSEQRGSLTIEHFNSVEQTNYPLTLVAGVAGDLTLRMVYDRQLFDTATITRILGHLHTILEGFVANPQQRLADVSLLTEAERQQLLVAWNDTAADFPSDTCVHSLFEAQVEQHPDAVAVLFEEQQLTYHELNQRANQLAHYLQTLGVQPETLVGICTERSLDMVVAVMGVLKAGGAYVPLDPTYPVERLQFMIDDTQVPLLLTQQTLLERAPDLTTLTQGNGTDHTPHVVYLDSDWETIAQQPSTNPTSGATADSLAYVIYTSGSTGRPKGTLLEHRGLCNLSSLCIREFNIGTHCRMLQFFAFGFDGSVIEIFVALPGGASLCLISRDVVLSSDDLARVIRDQAVTLCIMPPSMLATLPTDAMPALQAIISGGERCTREIVARWQADGRRFYNAYGPTEATVAVSWYPTHNLPATLTNIPIGRPLANTRLYVLDTSLHPVPIGVAGELHIGGVGLARGYLNRPDLTAEKFIPDPFSDEPDARLYKTGDLVRYLPDGTIEFLGRIDHQVKVRGFRIELGEIEAVLRQAPAVQDAVVLAREDVPGSKRLVAYCVTQPSGEQLPTSADLRNVLHATLPEYMVPSAFVMLDAFPLTPNGKVDRNALPAPDGTRPELESGYTAPRTEEEEILAGIWSKVLGVEQVGIHDNFFERGGDSILILQAMAHANKAGLRLTPRQFFEHPTIASLIAVMNTSAAVQAEQGVVTGVVPLTPIQHWFFENHPTEHHHFTLSILLELHTPLDTRLLEQAVGHLVRHHDMLRARFHRTSAGWQQTIAPVDEVVPVDYVDISSTAAIRQQHGIETEAAKWQASLNLTEGPVVRVVYFDLGKQRTHRLLVVFHHMVADIVLLPLFLEDMRIAYQQARRGESVVLPPKTTSFQHWAQRLLEHAQSTAVRQEMNYWMKLLYHAAAPLPVDQRGGANTYGTAKLVVMSLSTDETRALLQDIPAAYGTQMNEVLLTALALTITTWINRRELLIEVKGHGREDILEGVDLSRTMGWFITSFPLLLDLAQSSTPVEALRAVQSQMQALSNNGIGYGLLRYLCQDDDVRARMSALPQPQVSLNYLGQYHMDGDDASATAPVDQGILSSVTSFLMPGKRNASDSDENGDKSSDTTPPLWTIAAEARGAEQHADHPRGTLIQLVGVINDGELNLIWSYSSAVHKHSTVKRLAQEYIKQLQALIAASRAALAEDGARAASRGAIPMAEETLR